MPASRSPGRFPGWRFRAVHHLSRLLPPLIAPRFSAFLFPFERACQARDEPWANSVTGARARWPLDDIHGYHLALNSYYDWRLLAAAIAVTRPGDTIIEVGANIGTETVGLAAIAGASGRVIALEPLPANVNVLNRVLDDARIPNVTVLMAAACDREGQLSFVMPDPRMSGTGHLGTDKERSALAIQVEATTLDHIRGKYDARPTLLVMDVEGAELSVLRGAGRIILYDRPSIILEACNRHAERSGSSLSELKEELANWGYTVRAIGRYGLGDISTAADAEPCNWIAVPTERKALFRKIALNLIRTGVMPPRRHLNPLAVRH
jgi:FkbM family methyltransferase